MRYLDLNLMENVCHRHAVALFDIPNEPIPPFISHTKQLLDSALQSPKQTFDGKELYPTVTDKATILLYSLIKNHAFPNGNKRIATASMIIFLRINDFDVNATPLELASVALKTAESISKEHATNFIKDWLANHLIPIIA
jgi:death-on-curing protein